MKYFLILLLAACLSLNISCSSNSEETDSDLSSQATDELSEESADAMGDAFSGEESAGSEDLGGEALDEEVQADLGDESLDDLGSDLGEETSGEATTDEFALDDTAPAETDELDLDSGFSEPSTSDQDLAMMDQAPTTDSTEPPVASSELGENTDQPADSSFGSGGESSDTTTAMTDSGFGGEAESFDTVGGETAMPAEEFVQKPSWVPVKKIKTLPFTKNSKLLNTVYIVREGDVPEEVSQKVYGSSSTEEMYSDNPHLRKSFKPGDKIYYNSQARPNDSTRILTYYEDKGIPSKTYFARSGENIRKLSSELIGGSGAWKEIYATNPAIESKAELLQDMEIVYWPTGASSEMGLAMNEPAPAPEIMEPPVMEPSLPAPPPVAMDQDNNMAGAGSVAMNPPPPAPPAPPTMDMTPPPPPAPPTMGNDMAMAEQPNFAQERAAQRAKLKKQKAASSNDDLMVTLGAVLVAAGGALFLIVKKSRAKKMKMDITEQTQI